MCDVCGFQFKLKTLKDLVVKGRNTNIKACQECWNPDQPQLKLGEFPVNDPQAIRDPRPDRSLGVSGEYSSRDIQWGFGSPQNTNNPSQKKEGYTLDQKFNFKKGYQLLFYYKENKVYFFKNKNIFFAGVHLNYSILEWYNCYSWTNYI